MEEPVSESETPQAKSVGAKVLPDVRYTKSTSFRVIHCDGAVGALTPSRFLGMSLYSERVGLPDQSILKVSEDGNVIESLVVHKREIIREIEATVMLTVDEAESLGNWLLEQVQKARGRRK